MAYNPTNNSFTTISELSQQKGTPNAVVQVSGGSAFNDGSGGAYFWDDTSTVTADGIKVVQVPGVITGRWMRSKNNNYGTGQLTFSGIALTSRYTRPHNQSFIPTQIHIQARNAAAASGTSYVENITATNFDIVFTGIPLLGTNNITFDFLAIRGN